MAITHTFVSAKTDSTDATLVRPSNWNDDHTIAASTIFTTPVLTSPTINGTIVTTGLTLPDVHVGKLHYDSTGVYTELNAIWSLVRNVSTPPASVVFSNYILTYGIGNNTTFIGVGGQRLRVDDHATVDANSKGVLYGLNISLNPRVARNNVPYDDVTAIVIGNDSPDVVGGGVKATDAIYIGKRAEFGANPEWVQAIGIDSNADYALRATGTYLYGIRFDEATISTAAISIPNNTNIIAKDNAGTGTVNIVKVNTSDLIQFGANLAASTLGGTLTLNGQAFNAGAGNALISTTGSASGILIQSTNDGAYGAQIIMQQVTTSPAVGDIPLQLRARSKDSGGTTTDYGNIQIKIADPTDTTETGVLYVNLLAAGADNLAMTLSGAGALWSDLSVDTLTYKVSGTQVVGARVVDARCDDVVDNTYGAEEAGVLDALRDCLITHGLLAAA